MRARKASSAGQSPEVMVRVHRVEETVSVGCGHDAADLKIT